MRAQNLFPQSMPAVFVRFLCAGAGGDLPCFALAKSRGEA